MNILGVITKYLLERTKIIVLYRLGKAIGDQTAMTSVIAQMHSESGYKFIIFSTFPDIFKYNPNVLLNINYNKIPRGLKKITFLLLKALDKKNVYSFSLRDDTRTYTEHLKQTKSIEHLVTINARNITNIKNKEKVYPTQLFLSEKEINGFRDKFPFNNYSIIQSVGKTTYTNIKEWGALKYQEVVKNTPQINWIQLGSLEDPLLTGVIDLRGKTNLRELFYLISKSNFVLANEGLFNHIAAAFNTKSFVVFSGFTPISYVKYSSTIPISKEPQVSCAPCWIRGNCPLEVKECTEGISIDQVVNSIEYFTNNHSDTKK